jgi:Rieske Fe-S protein
VQDLTTDGKALVTPFTGTNHDSIMVVREPGGQLLALSMTCTHAGCRVKPPVAGVIGCPCHGSQYDLTGKVIRGPALQPLAQYPIIAYNEQSKRVTIQIK